MLSCYRLNTSTYEHERIKNEAPFISEQPHQLKYEAEKEGATPKKVEAAKKAAGSNQQSSVEKELKGKK